jgi:hypothetical protein
MTNKTTTKLTRQRNTQTSTPVVAETPVHVELAAEAVLERWIHDQVIDTLISRISRDRRYLAYRKACNRRTSYDDQVQHDMRALALAACWLAEQRESVACVAGVAAPDQRGRQRPRQTSGDKTQDEVASI